MAYVRVNMVEFESAEAMQGNAKFMSENAGQIFPDIQLFASMATTEKSALAISIYADKEAADKAIAQRDKYHAERGNVEVVMAHEGKLNGFYHKPIVEP